MATSTAANKNAFFVCKTDSDKGTCKDKFIEADKHTKDDVAHDSKMRKVGAAC